MTTWAWGGDARMTMSVSPSSGRGPGSLEGLIGIMVMVSGTNLSVDGQAVPIRSVGELKRPRVRHGIECAKWSGGPVE